MVNLLTKLLFILKISITIKKILEINCFVENTLGILLLIFKKYTVIEIPILKTSYIEKYSSSMFFY